MHSTSPHTKAFLIYLMVTAMLCGALVMVVEILGSRVIGPFFGVGLFVWTSLIAVTLLALALGYWLGGHWADRDDNPDHLYAIILASGLLVLVVPFVKAEILELCLPLGLRLGAFSSTLLLFGPSLFLLGCVSPYLVKIATREFHLLGRTVGRFYALSTLGSVVGTVLAGFFLIAYLGVNTIFQLTSALLIMLSVVYFCAFKRKWWVLGFVVVPFIPLHPSPPVDKIMPNGTRVSEVLSTESYYGHIKVVDYTYRDQHIRDLMIDGLTQGGLDLVSGLPLYEYSYLLSLIPHKLNPQGKNGLVVGLGAGMVPRWYEQRGVIMDVVEIDPVVANIARDYFDLKINGEIIISDARYYLSSTEKKYDFIILDVFTGDLTPGHLISSEAFSLVKSRMSDDSIFALNLIVSVAKDNYMTASVIKTLKQHFDHVTLYPTSVLMEGSDVGNVVVVAYNGSVREFNANALETVEVYSRIKHKVIMDMRRPLELPAVSNAIVLTDDYNPIDFFDAGIREFARLSILKTTEFELLAN